MSRPSGDYVGGCSEDYSVQKKAAAAAAEKSAAAKAAADKAAREQKAKEDAAKRQQAEIEKQGRQQLLGGLKDVTLSAPENAITLKPIPSTAGSARSQLDCASHNGGVERDPNDRKPLDCSLESPKVPEPPKPEFAGSGVPATPQDIARFLQETGHKISVSRDALARQDQEIVTLSKAVEQAENLAIKKEGAGESDALRRAREALVKARAERNKTAAELAKLEKMERMAKDKAMPQ